jgi:hypothetical protein
MLARASEQFKYVHTPQWPMKIPLTRSDTRHTYARSGVDKLHLAGFIPGSFFVHNTAKSPSATYNRYLPFLAKTAVGSLTTSFPTVYSAVHSLRELEHSAEKLQLTLELEDPTNPYIYTATPSSVATSLERAVALSGDACGAIEEAFQCCASINLVDGNLRLQFPVKSRLLASNTPSSPTAWVSTSAVFWLAWWPEEQMQDKDTPAISDSEKKRKGKGKAPATRKKPRPTTSSKQAKPKGKGKK